MALSEVESLVAIAVSLLAILATVTGWFGKAVSFVSNALRRGPRPGNILVPKRTLVIHPPTHPNGFLWSLGSSGGQPAVHIHGDFFATNISVYKVVIVGVSLKKPRARGYAFAQKVGESIYGGYAIPEGENTHVQFGFWIVPPFRTAGESFTTDMAVIDQFGNEHWLKGIEFKYAG